MLELNSFIFAVILDLVVHDYYPLPPPASLYIGGSRMVYTRHVGLPGWHRLRGRGYDTFKRGGWR